MSWKDDKNLGPWSFEAGEEWKVKDLGPWDFTKQPDKLHCNQGNRISSAEDPTFSMDFTGEPVTPTHKPCGYWHSVPKSRFPKSWPEFEPESVWKFKLFQDSDDTIRDGEGNITISSGTLVDLTGLKIIRIYDSDYNEVGTVPGYDPEYPEYWTYVEVENTWYFDDSEDYPDNAWIGSYNITTEYWSVEQQRTPLPEEKFFVFYNTREYNIPQHMLGYYGIQYPYKYKSADRWQPADMIAIGTYEANIPYWNNYYEEHYGDGQIHYVWNPAPIELTDCYVFTPIECSEYAGFSLCVSGTPHAFWKDQFSFTNKLKTSIPYWVRYQYARAVLYPYGYRTLPSSDCGAINETGTPLADLITFISADSLFNKTEGEMVIWPVGYNVAHSTWQDIPASILTEDARTLTITNNKPHDEYSWEGQRDLVYIRWAYWNWAEIIFEFDDYEESEDDFF